MADVNPFDYIEAPKELAPNFQNLSVVFTQCYEWILQNCPQSAERTIAIRKLQESRMWANASLVFSRVWYDT
jgi:hypothetical protein